MSEEDRRRAFAGLEEVLAAEERLYLELRDLLQQERRCIVELDARGLEEVVERKEALAAEGRLLEEGRIEVTRHLARELGLDSDSATLSGLCAALGAEGERLREAHSRLVALLGAVRELLDANASFAGDSIAQVRATLQLLGRLLPTEPTYGPTAPTAAGRTGRIVRRAV